MSAREAAIPTRKRYVPFLRNKVQQSGYLSLSPVVSCVGFCSGSPVLFVIESLNRKMTQMIPHFFLSFWLVAFCLPAVVCVGVFVSIFSGGLEVETASFSWLV